MMDGMFPGVATSSSVERQSRALDIMLCTLVPDGDECEFGSIDPNLLSEAERQRAARFVFARDYWSYAAAHALLRSMLAECHGQAPLDWRFRHNAHGRPEIDPVGSPMPPPRFNISHTHGMAACALTTGSLPEGVDVGVDAESLHRTPDALALGERYFSKGEAAWLRGLPKRQLDTEFLRLWTLKEAVAKACGVGLGMDLKSFSCRVNPPAVSFDKPVSNASSRWTLHNWQVCPHHWVSLAVRHPSDTLINLTIRHLSGNSPSFNSDPQ
jgi:4'-phosphopantetheinyl transferase